MKKNWQPSIRKRHKIWNAVPQIANIVEQANHYAPSNLELDFYVNLIDSHFWSQESQTRRMLVLGVTVELAKMGIDKGFDVTCVDFSGNMIELRKPSIDESVVVEENEWSRIGFPQHHFSLIVGDCAINNVPKNVLGAFLAKIHHILSPDGLCIFKEIVRIEEKTKPDIKDLIKKYKSDEISESNFYTSLRFNYLLSPETYNEESKELYGESVFEQINKLECLDNETKLKLLQFKNSVIHTIYTKDELSSILADKLGTSYVVPNIEHEVFNVFVVDRTSTLFDYDRKDSDYISMRNSQSMDVIARSITNEFVHLCVIDWEIGGLNDVKSGEMRNADIRIKIPDQSTNEHERFEYLATIPLYELVKGEKEKRITDYLFKQDDVTGLVVTLTSDNQIKINISGDTVHVTFPESLISNIKKINQLASLAGLLKNGYKDYLKQRLQKEKELTCLTFADLSRSYYHDYQKKLSVSTTNEQGAGNNIANEIKALVLNVTPIPFRKYIDSLFLPCIRTLLFGLNTKYECKYLKYYVYPSLTKRNQEIALVGLMLFSNKEIEFYNKGSTDNLIKEYCTHLSIWKWGNKVHSEVSKHALRAAIAAIMGRNMSHNLGSHAIWYLAQKIADNNKLGEDILNTLPKLFEVFEEAKGNISRPQEGQLKVALSEHKSSLQQVKNILNDNKKMRDFLDYVRERMGFVGLVSTTQPSWTSSESLRKVLKRFQDGIVKEHIVESEISNTKYEIEYVSRVNKDVLIDFTHASYGHQAFYLILENIIRNSIKHNINNLPHPTIKFLIEVSQPEPENIEVKHNFYRIRISDNIKCCDTSLVERLNKYIADEIIKKDASVNNQYLGMKEKKIAAAFLRMEKTDVLMPDADQLDPPILTIHCCKDKNDCKCFSSERGECTNEGNLVFEFYLRKPKECLIVSERNDLINQSDNLSLHGIDVCQNLYNLIKWQVPHRFIIFDLCKGNEIQLEKVIKHIREHRLNLPYRIGFVVNNGLTFKMNNEVAWESKIFKAKKDIIDKVANNASEDGCQKFIEALWEAWLPILRSPLPELYFIDNVNKELPRGTYINKNDGNINGSVVFCHAKANIEADKLFYYDEYSGKMQELANSKSANLLYEACLYKVAVVDERINSTKNKKITLVKDYRGTKKQIWENRRLKIIDHDPIIENMNISEVTEYKPHILIIHMGVIDKAQKNNQKKFEEKWNKIQTDIPWIIIDSDRGKDDKIKEYGGRWLHFSDLGQLIINDAEKYTSKLGLINIITSQRERSVGCEH